MILVVPLHLDPTPDQASALAETVRRFNSACNYVSKAAYENKIFGRIGIHNLTYYSTRKNELISADSTIMVISQVADSYKKSKQKVAEFRHDAAVPFQTGSRRQIRFLLEDRKINIATFSGRHKIAFRCAKSQIKKLSSLMGQADLICRNGKWMLICCIDVSEENQIDIHGWIGVDLGIVSLATTSVGQEFGGGQVDKIRRKSLRRRKTYQRRNTRSARRRLNKLSGRQSRFQRNVNHVVSKAVVARAKALQCGIVLEDLKGISSERTVTKALRQRLGNWGFFQLRKFIEYKARLAGIPVWLVNPRNTSRTCFLCGHCDKANRRKQSEFSCTACGFTASADQNAACNLARLGEQQSTSLTQSRTPANSPAQATSRRQKTRSG